MNYKLHYDKLIQKAKNRCILKLEYSEKHHIVPKCMGGNNSKDNLVRLFPDEHLVAHLLLHKIYPDVLGLAMAVVQMTKRGKLTNSKSYAIIRKSAAKRIGVHNSKLLIEKFSKMTPEERSRIHGSHGENNPMYGKTHSDETKEKISKLKKLLVGEKHPHFGKESKLKGKSYEEQFGKEKAEKLKKERSEKLKGVDRSYQKGENNPAKRDDVRRKISEARQIPIEIDGILYPSKKEACIILGLSHYMLDKLIKSSTITKKE